MKSIKEKLKDLKSKTESKKKSLKNHIPKKEDLYFENNAFNFLEKEVYSVIK